MATIKRIPDTYDVYVPTMTVHGNLNIVGNTTTINSATVNADDLLMFNTNSAVNLNASIGVYRPTAANVFVRWNESTTSWQLTNDGTNYYNILASGVATGNINITGTTLFTDSTKGSVQLFANTASSGGSGLYVTNTLTTNAELVTKSKAVAYSIVFG